MAKRNHSEPGVVTNKRAHFFCASCSRQAWREGGHATALKHFQMTHPGDVPSYSLDIRYGVSYTPSKATASTGSSHCRNNHRYTESDRRSDGTRQCQTCRAEAVSRRGNR